MKWSRIGICALPLAFACGAAPPSEDPFSTGVYDPGDSDGTGSPGGEGDEDEDSDSGGIRFDTPDGDSTGGPGDGGSNTGCRGIDFLFVIDSSPSMEDEQANLIASFPGLIQTIEDKLEDQAQDYQVLVTDTDDWYGICETLCSIAPNSPCNGVPCNAPACETTLGAGIRNDQSGLPCPIAGPQRFIDGQSNLEQAFACVAEVGTWGNGYERVMQATTEALALDAPDDCNEGFLREDAILVVTFITDEEDSHEKDGSPGDPADWYDAVLAAKGGDPGAVVTLGLIGDHGTPNPICEPYGGDNGTVGAEAAPRLRQFVELFGEHGLWSSVCASDYDEAFQQAVDVIELTCSDFMPPG